jgi:hypothetical protein
MCGDSGYRPIQVGSHISVNNTEVQGVLQPLDALDVKMWLSLQHYRHWSCQVA